MDGRRSALQSTGASRCQRPVRRLRSFASLAASTCRRDVAGRVPTGLDHLVVGVLDAGHVHRTDPAGLRIAAVHDLQVLHQLDRRLDVLVRHVGVVPADQCVGRSAVTVHVVVPADDAGLHEAAYEIRLLLNHLSARLDRGRVGAEALIGQQVDHRVEAGLALHVDGFADGVALLHHALVGEEGAKIEGVGLELLVAKSVIGLHPLPEAELPVLADQHGGRLLQVVPLVVALPGVGDDGLRVLLEDGADHRHRHAVLYLVEGQQQVAGHQEVDLAGGQHGPVVHLRATLLDLHLQVVAPVGAVGHRLVEAAMAGLCAPVGGKDHLVLGPGGQRRGSGQGAGHQRAAVDGESSCRHGSLLGVGRGGELKVKGRERIGSGLAQRYFRWAAAAAPSKQTIRGSCPGSSGP